MASTDAAFLNRPKSNPTVEDLVKYILQTEIITTAHDGAYSGTFVHMHASNTFNMHNYYTSIICRSAAGTVFSRLIMHHNKAAYRGTVCRLWL